MSENPLVSIIINTHNDTKYLGEAIESALSQTYKNYEIILFDNASNINIIDSIKQYEDKINYYRSDKFLTLGAARNAAISCTNGEFITFLDADDIFIENKLAKQVPCFNDEAISLVYSNTYNLIKKDGRWCDIKLYDRSMPEGNIFSKLLNGNFIPFNTAVIRKSTLGDDSENWFFERFDFCTDYELFLRISHKFKVHYVDEVLGKWRVHGQNYTYKKPYLISAELYLMIPRILEYEPELFHKYKKQMNYFVSEIFLYMGRYFMHIEQRYKAILCVLNALTNDLNSKNFRVLIRYLFSGIKNKI